MIPCKFPVCAYMRQLLGHHAIKQVTPLEKVLYFLVHVLARSLLCIVMCQWFSAICSPPAGKHENTGELPHKETKLQYRFWQPERTPPVLVGNGLLSLAPQ
jgi:hypothetical protein